ncbi:hypothetical protein [Streptomyces sp. NPDC056144]|uniref:hypothetical protein n=1 Tax=unclassified Streptomyces TaxID=2593676 RepID=UPI0035DD6F63
MTAAPTPAEPFHGLITSLKADAARLESCSRELAGHALALGELDGAPPAGAAALTRQAECCAHAAGELRTAADALARHARAVAARAPRAAAPGLA